MITYRVRVKQTCYFDIEATSKENAKAQLLGEEPNMEGDVEEYIWDETAAGYDYEIEAEEVTKL